MNKLSFQENEREREREREREKSKLEKKHDFRYDTLWCQNLLFLQKSNLLIHLRLIFPFYTVGKHWEIKDLLMFSGGQK